MKSRETMKQITEHFFDIYDEQVWRDFQTHEGRPFHWFQLFSRSRYTVGVIYLVILNLPRSIHFRPESIMITGIIPDPKEPKNMNSN